MTHRHYTDVIDGWDPGTAADLPDEVALHMDECDRCAAAFDERFQAWTDASSPVAPPTHLLPKVPANNNRGWRVLGSTIAGLMLGINFALVGRGMVTSGIFEPTFQTIAFATTPGSPDPRSVMDWLPSWSRSPKAAPPQSKHPSRTVGDPQRTHIDGVAAPRYPKTEMQLKQLGYIEVTRQQTDEDAPQFRGRDEVFWRHTVSSGEGYRNYGVNVVEVTAEDKLSTFSADVDTASYTMARRKLSDGYLPRTASVRVEEFVNYFPYDYIPPTSDPFSVAFEVAPTPWNGATWLVRVGVQGRRVSVFERKPVHLTFLVDTSGSMRSSDKLDLVKTSLTMLTEALQDGDTVAIVGYAGHAGIILEPTPMSQKQGILDALERLSAGGKTAMGSGIELAYQLAAHTYADGAVNRVVIASDGNANVGQTDHQELSDQIAGFANRGITLTTLGFGTGNYQDTMMEQLANQGDGNYYYIDSEREARRIFVDKLCATMEVIAKDVKIQVDWNEDRVKGYRLVGYENRDIADEDFRNDAVDAGEIGAGHQVTALYEVVLKEGSGDLATVRIRNKAPGPEAPAVERTYPMSETVVQQDFDESSADFRIATAAAAFAELLRESPHIQEMTYLNVAHIARNARRPEYDEDDELVQLLEEAARLSAP